MPVAGVQKVPERVYVASSETLALKAGGEIGTRAVKFCMKSVRSTLDVKGAPAKTWFVEVMVNGIV